MVAGHRQRKVRCAIIGLGNIAWCYDHGQPLHDIGKTHASVISANPRTELIAGADPDSAARAAFSETLDVETHNDLDSLLALQPDLVSICSPSELHCAHLTACIEAGIEMIWLEKPAATTLSELDRALRMWEQNGRRSIICVNFQRRFMPAYQTLRNAAIDHGNPKGISLVYSRGLETNGSHIIDMAFACLGDPGDYDLLWASADYDNPSFAARIGETEVVAQGMTLDYHCIDLSITFAEGREAVLHGGMTALTESRIEHAAYPGFYRLSNAKQHLQPEEALHGMGTAMSASLQDLLAARDQQRQPASSLLTARQSQALIDSIRQYQSAVR